MLGVGRWDPLKMKKTRGVVDEERNEIWESFPPTHVGGGGGGGGGGGRKETWWWKSTPQNVNIGERVRRRLIRVMTQTRPII